MTAPRPWRRAFCRRPGLELCARSTRCREAALECV